MIVTARYLILMMFSRTITSRVYEAWIFLIRFLVISVTSRFVPKSFRLYFHPWSFCPPYPSHFVPSTIFPLDVPPPPPPIRFAPSFGNVLYACMHVHVLYSGKIQGNSFIMLCLGSIEPDHVINEPCYKGIIL